MDERRTWIASALVVTTVLAAAAAGCTGSRRGGTGLPTDAGPRSDAGRAGSGDGGVGPGVDSGVGPGVDSGVGPGVDAGRPPGVDAGAGMCTNFSGAYSVVGDCEVTYCDVSQTGCSLVAACDGPIGSLEGTVTGTTAMLSSPFGECYVTLDTATGDLNGMCVAGSTLCSFTAYPG